MVTFESAGSGAGRRGGDRAVNVSQRVGGIKRDKKIQSGLIMRLIQARMRFCVKWRFQTIWRTIEAHLRSYNPLFQKMLWFPQTFRATLDSRDYAALNPAYLHQGAAAH
jgi:hypothetical protein